MRAPFLSSSPSLCFHSRLPTARFQSLHFHCSMNRSDTVDVVRAEYKPGLFDDFLLNFFRKKMVQEAGWDSVKEGYDGLIEIANQLMKGKTRAQTEQSAVRVIKSLFPAWLLVLFKIVFVPLYDGKLASLMVARVTAVSCKWLMGPCSVNSITLPDGNNCSSGTFFKECMGVDLYMEPKFEDYSCQFNFGVPPPPLANDKVLNEPCLEICTNRNRRKSGMLQCPQL